ncbi:MAG: hypothetical protein AAGD07_07465 [Planctomycetota bacterium]
MRSVLGSLLVLTVFVVVGCGSNEAGIVVDTDEMEQYNVPEGEMEAAMDAMATDSAKKK